MSSVESRERFQRALVELSRARRRRPPRGREPVAGWRARDGDGDGHHGQPGPAGPTEDSVAAGPAPPVEAPPVSAPPVEAPPPMEAPPVDAPSLAAPPEEAPPPLEPSPWTALADLVARLDRIEKRLTDLSRRVEASREGFEEWVRLGYWAHLRFAEFLRLRRAGMI